MSNPYPNPVYVPEPSLPPLSPVTTPSFVPGVSETYFYYQLDSDGSIARGSRVVTTAVDGTQTVQVLDAADAPLVAGSYEVVQAPEVVMLAGAAASSGVSQDRGGNRYVEPPERSGVPGGHHRNELALHPNRRSRANS